MGEPTVVPEKALHVPVERAKIAEGTVREVMVGKALSVEEIEKGLDRLCFRLPAGDEELSFGTVAMEGRENRDPGLAAPVLASAAAPGMQCDDR
jgi:hypothetical protein